MSGIKPVIGFIQEKVNGSATLKEAISNIYSAHNDVMKAIEEKKNEKQIEEKRDPLKDINIQEIKENSERLVIRENSEVEER